MATTKKQLEDEFTKAAKAQTAADVNAQDSRTRLWQSLDYTYGKQLEESDKAYDKAIAQTDRTAMGRGMGRSSYNSQIMANMQNEKVNAANDIRSAQIADYQNRISEIENQEKEDERWDRKTHV